MPIVCPAGICGKPHFAKDNVGLTTAFLKILSGGIQRGNNGGRSFRPEFSSDIIAAIIGKNASGSGMFSFAYTVGKQPQIMRQIKNGPALIFADSHIGRQPALHTDDISGLYERAFPFRQPLQPVHNDNSPAGSLDSHTDNGILAIQIHLSGRLKANSDNPGSKGNQFFPVRLRSLPFD
ncbi:hypothetical protein QUW15_04880 [Desulfovibrio piger]|nr:hypothetical protein [Desulfovibrio piger]